MEVTVVVVTMHVRHSTGHRDRSTSPLNGSEHSCGPFDFWLGQSGGSSLPLHTVSSPDGVVSGTPLSFPSVVAGRVVVPPTTSLLHVPQRTRQEAATVGP